MLARPALGPFGASDQILVPSLVQDNVTLIALRYNLYSAQRNGEYSLG